MPSVALSDTMPDLSNKTFDNGRYRLLEQLGTGAYGRVYRALDNTSPSTKPAYYAVKCLVRPKQGSRQDDFQRREFTLHNLVCSHPNIVSMHKVIVQGDIVYVIMDLCTGGDLFTAITENSVYSGKDALLKKSFIELLDAIHWCHEQGVFHRDIKPENVLCSADGSNLQLADFGLCTRQRVSRDFGCGSSYYMSPECIGKEVRMHMYSTRSSDVWSLGVILVNMITGRNPWRYATTKDECFAAYVSDTSFLRQVLPISEEVGAIINRIFTLNPQDRIRLPELREKILGVKSFFMSQRELAMASACVRDAAKGYGLRVPPARLPTVAPIAVVVDQPVEGHVALSTSSEGFLFPSPGGRSQSSLGEEGPAYIIGDDDPVDSTIEDSSSSSASSDGPITPETHPADPQVGIPEIAELSLCQPAAHVTNDVVTKETLVAAGAGHKAPSKPSRFIQMAVQRLKGITPGSII